MTIKRYTANIVNGKLIPDKDGPWIHLDHTLSAVFEVVCNEKWCQYKDALNWPNCKTINGAATIDRCPRITEIRELLNGS